MTQYCCLSWQHTEQYQNNIFLSPRHIVQLHCSFKYCFPSSGLVRAPNILFKDVTKIPSEGQMQRYYFFFSVWLHTAWNIRAQTQQSQIWHASSLMALSPRSKKFTSQAGLSQTSWHWTDLSHSSGDFEKCLLGKFMTHADRTQRHYLWVNMQEVGGKYISWRRHSLHASVRISSDSCEWSPL